MLRFFGILITKYVLNYKMTKIIMLCTVKMAKIKIEQCEFNISVQIIIILY